MGDRALIQLKSGDELSPVLYLHWGGGDVKRIIDATQERMKNRPGDINYIFARMVSIAIDGNEGDTGYGVWNQTKKLVEADTHYDAGCFVVDVSRPTYTVETFGGYGFGGDD